MSNAAPGQQTSKRVSLLTRLLYSLSCSLTLSETFALVDTNNDGLLQLEVSPGIATTLSLLLLPLCVLPVPDIDNNFV